MTARPPITLSTLDAERLERLLDSLPDAECPGKAELLEELARATLVAPAEVPPNVVSMNSTARFRVDDTGEEFEATLVYPKELQGEGRRLSVLSPAGGALLGLAEGDAISWPGPGGRELHLRILEVTYQPERAGVLHR